MNPVWLIKKILFSPLPLSQRTILNSLLPLILSLVVEALMVVAVAVGQTVVPLEIFLQNMIPVQFVKSILKLAILLSLAISSLISLNKPHHTLPFLLI